MAARLFISRSCLRKLHDAPFQFNLRQFSATCFRRTQNKDTWGQAKDKAKSMNKTVDEKMKEGKEKLKDYSKQAGFVANDEKQTAKDAMKEASRKTREFTEAAKKKGKGAMDTAKDMYHKVQSKTGQSAEAAGEKTKEKASDTSKTIKKKVKGMKDYAQDTFDEHSATVQEETRRQSLRNAHPNKKNNS